MRIAAATFITILLTVPAMAGEAAKDDAKKGPAKSATSVDMPILVAPMVTDGKLFAYAYLNPVIEAASDSAVLKVRDKTPFLQDAFIRDLNGATIVDPKAPDQFDRAGTAARLLADARRVVGAGAIKGLSFSQVQVSPRTPKDAAVMEAAKTPPPAAPPAAAVTAPAPVQAAAAPAKPGGH